MSTKYNGWSNRETWNVALWINNTESLYDIARTAKSYTDFVRIIPDRYSTLHELYKGTPDGTAWNSKALNRRELSAMIREFRT